MTGIDFAETVIARKIIQRGTKIIEELKPIKWHGVKSKGIVNIQKIITIR